jgi:hypothetical protein
MIHGTRIEELGVRRVVAKKSSHAIIFAEKEAR